MAVVGSPPGPLPGARLGLGRREAVRPDLRVAQGQGVVRSRWEDRLLFLLVAVIGSGVGIWVAVGLHMFHVDNVARTREAVQVIGGFEPKLTNIGFIWAPLPALVQIPLVALFPGLAYEGAIGPVVSALAAAVSLVLLNRILVRYVPRRRFRYLLLALYQSNPLIVYLTITGLSEMIVLMFVLLAWLAFQRVTFEEPLPLAQVAVMGAAMAGGVLTRYEGLGFALSLGALVVVVFYLQKRPRQREVAEAVTLAYMAPWSFAFGLWVFFNATIMGNPLHFVTGKGSASDHARALLASNETLAALVGDVPGSALHALHAAWNVAPVFVLLLPVALWLAALRRDVFLMGMVIAGLSFTGMQGLLYLTGGSLGWLRYHVYLAAFAPILLGYCLRPGYCPLADRVPRHLALVVGAFLVVWSAAMTWRGLDDTSFVLGYEPHFLATVAAGPEAAAAYPKGGRDIALYFRDVLFPAEPDALVLLDDQQATEITLFSTYLNRLVVPNVSRFADYVKDPTGKVTHILVPERADIGTDLILQAYPDLFEEGAPFATLEQEFTTPTLRWRLYRVKPREGGRPLPPR